MSGPRLEYFRTLLDSFATLVDTAIPILIGLALIAFFWGLIQYVFYSGNEQKKKSGKDIMIAGLVGLFVMVSVWGIIRLAQGVFGIRSNIEAGQDLTSPRVPR